MLQPLSPPLLRSPLRRSLPPAPALPRLTLRGQGLGAPALRSDSRGGEREGEAAGSSAQRLRLRECVGRGPSSRLSSVLTGAPFASRPLSHVRPSHPSSPARDRTAEGRGGSSAMPGRSRRVLQRFSDAMPFGVGRRVGIPDCWGRFLLPSTRLLDPLSGKTALSDSKRA